MPNVAAPLFHQALFPKELQTPMRQVLQGQDTFNRGLAKAMVKALVVGDTLQVLQPFTAAAPLVVPTDWQTPSLAAGWTALDTTNFPIRYRKDATGLVTVEGLAVNAGAAPGSAFTLAAGYRPEHDQITATIISTAVVTNFGRLDFRADGSCGIYFGTPSTWGSLRGSFQASADTPYVPSCFPFDVQWPLPAPPTLVLVQLQDITNAAGPANLAIGLPDWVMVVKGQSQLIHVRSIPGIPPSRSYAVTLIAF